MTVLNGYRNIAIDHGGNSMSLILFYIKSTLLGVIPYLPIILIFRLLMVYLLKRCGYRTGIEHEAGTMVFIMCLLALAMTTISFTLSQILRGVVSSLGGFNLIPLKGIGAILRSSDLGYILVNLLGNIMMFVPIGFFLPLLWQRMNSMKITVLVCFFISLFIEVLQLFGMRGTDVDDLILNTAGGLVGYLIFWLMKKRFPEFTGRFRLKRVITEESTA